MAKGFVGRAVEVMASAIGTILAVSIGFLVLAGIIYALTFVDITLVLSIVVGGFLFFFLLALLG